ncbi:MAG: hypothetical protein DME19_08400, partial [Verrucomicrobia bacterium]
MKTMKNLILLVAFVVASPGAATGQQADSAKDGKQVTATEPKSGEPPPAGKPAAETDGKAPAVPAAAVAGANGDKGLRLNFRGVPLEIVLNYLSDAAGFIINIKPGTDVNGKVDVWSNQPLNKDEAVDLLNTVLN